MRASLFLHKKIKKKKKSFNHSKLLDKDLFLRSNEKQLLKENKPNYTGVVGANTIKTSNYNVPTYPTYLRK